MNLANKTSQRPFVIFIALALLSGAGCAGMTQPGGERELMAIAEPQELDMAASLYPNIIWGAEGGGGEYRDERLEAYLSEIVDNLHKVSHRPGLPLRFIIQNTSLPGAWALPGYAVITRGLLASLQSEAEFAFIMARQIGHVAVRHSSKEITYGAARKIEVSQPSQDRYAEPALAVGDLKSDIQFFSYGKAQELDADSLGVLYMRRLGYDPSNSLKAQENFLRALTSYRTAGQGNWTASTAASWAQTTPEDLTRAIANTKPLSTTRPARPVGDGTNREAFLSMTEGLRKINAIYAEKYDKAALALQGGKHDEAQRLAAEAVGLDKTQPAFFAISGFALLAAGDYAEAEKYFELSLVIDPAYQPAHRGAGAAHYLREAYPDAVKHLLKAIEIFPKDVNSHYFAGMSYYKLQNWTMAVTHLNIFAESRPDHPDVHWMLGTSYENMGDHHSAYDEYIFQLRVAPASELGKQAALRAKLLKQLMERMNQQQ